MTNYSDLLRSELLERAEAFTARTGLEPYVYRSKGQTPTVLFKKHGSVGAPQHGNFMPASYAAIQGTPTWEQRLGKPHSQRVRALHEQDQASAKELDSCTSSDALLMNIFCHPSTGTNRQLAALFGLKGTLALEFGFKANLPFAGGGTEPRSSEIDLKLSDGPLGRTVLIEAKLTEHDFTSREKMHVEHYSGFAQVFTTHQLPIEGDKYRHYQLLRNVLAANHFNGWFCLVCDQRRQDLQDAWREVMQAVTSSKLRSRCRMITWQQIATTLPVELQAFLEEKYGIRSA